MDHVRRNPIPRPAGPNPKGVIPQSQILPQGQPPLPSGQPVLTPYTQQELAKLGWKPGDPVPGDLSTVIAQLQRDIATDKAQAGEAMIKEGLRSPARRAELVSIDKLSPEAQAELRNYLREHKITVDQQQRVAQAQRAEEAELDAQVASGVVPADVAAGMRVMRQAAAGSTGGIIDDRPPPIPVPEGKVAAGNIGIPLMQTPPSPPPPATVTPPPSVETTPTDTAQAPPLLCPRCNWDHRVVYEVKPTAEDIQRFTATWLGGTEFKKSYSALKGSFTVTFRGLTSEEVILINHQLALDVRAGRIMGDGEYITGLIEYRQILATHRVEANGHVLAQPPTLAQFRANNPPNIDPLQTDLVRMRDAFYTQHVTLEAVRHWIGHKYREFQDLTGALGAKMLDPDFFEGIA